MPRQAPVALEALAPRYWAARQAATRRRLTIAPYAAGDVPRWLETLRRARRQVLSAGARCAYRQTGWLVRVRPHSPARPYTVRRSGTRTDHVRRGVPTIQRLQVRLHGRLWFLPAIRVRARTDGRTGREPTRPTNRTPASS